MTLSTTLVLNEQRISNYSDLTTIKRDDKMVLQEQITKMVKCFYCGLDTNSDLDVTYDNGLSLSMVYVDAQGQYVHVNQKVSIPF